VVYPMDVGPALRWCSNPRDFKERMDE